MMNSSLRRILGVAALVTLSVGSAPRMQVARDGSRNADVVATHTVGNGWGSMLGCVGCGLGAAAIIAGGPGAIAVAISEPGSSLVLLSCIAACSDAVK